MSYEALLEEITPVVVFAEASDRILVETLITEFQELEEAVPQEAGDQLKTAIREMLSRLTSILDGGSRNPEADYRWVVTTFSGLVQSSSRYFSDSAAVSGRRE